MNENESQEAALEVLQPSAVQALEAASIDIQIKTAHAYPRSMKNFKERGLAMVSMDEETADSCIYVRPVGKELDKVTGRWIEKMAEGPSIRCAEIVAACYGNIRVGARIIEQTERYVKCAGFAHDLESNSAGGAEVTEATVTKEGKPYSERQRALVAKATISKAYRDAVFRIVPRALAKPLLEAAKRIISGTDKPLAERIKRVQSWLQSKKIEDARVFDLLGITEWAKITPEHLITLTGLSTGIKDGELTIDEAFPAVAKAPEPTGLQQSQTGAGTKKPEPAKTTETAKEKPKEAPKPAQEPAGASTPAQPTNVATAPSSEQPTPAKKQSKTSPATDQNEEAKVGLAPLPPFQRDPKDTDEVSSIKFLACNAGFTEEQVMVWAKSKGVNLAKEAQKSLNELSTAKLLSLGKAWQNNPAEFAKNIKAANGI